MCIGIEDAITIISVPTGKGTLAVRKPLRRNDVGIYRANEVSCKQLLGSEANV